VFKGTGHMKRPHPSTNIDDCDQQSRDISVRQAAVEQRRSQAVGPAINQFSSRLNCLTWPVRTDSNCRQLVSKTRTLPLSYGPICGAAN